MPSEHFAYTYLGFDLTVPNLERERGIVVENRNSVCGSSEKEKNSVVGMIRQGVENKTACIVVPLYKAMVLLLHLEWGVQSHLSWKKETKTIKIMGYLPYEKK